jgi:predicted acetyltransferase
MVVMLENILVWAIVAAVGFICLRWAYNTLFGQKGGGCGCGRAGCPLRQDGACPESQENVG